MVIRRALILIIVSGLGLRNVEVVKHMERFFLKFTRDLRSGLLQVYQTPLHNFMILV